MAAVVLGAIYAYGVTVKATSLSGAGVRVSDTLPLVPIEQLLLIGVKGCVQFAIVAAIALLVQLVVQGWRSTGPAAPQQARRRRSGAGRVLVWVAAALGGAVALLFGTIPMLLGLAALYGLYRLVEGGRLTPGVSLVAMALAIVLINAGYEYVDPDPLPRVVLHTDEHVLRGGLIATSGGTWWLAIGRDRFVGIPEEDVQTSRLRSPAHRTKSVLSLLTGER